MLEEIWQKDVPITFQLFEDDVACQVLPLPFVLEARFNHYLGFYFQAVQQFFFRYALQPNIKEQFWLEYTTPQGATIELKPTDLIVILYMRYFRFSDESPIIRVHYRKDVECAAVDLAVYYRQSLKASTVLKNRKQGVAAIVSVFSNSQINSLVESLKQSDFKHFYGAEPNQEQEQPGFRVLMKQHDTVPLRIYSKCQRLERAYDPSSSILDVKRSLNIDGSVAASVWGVPIANPICLRELLELCHADGFLYLYVDV